MKYKKHQAVIESCIICQLNFHEQLEQVLMIYTVPLFVKCHNFLDLLWVTNIKQHTHIHLQRKIGPYNIISDVTFTDISCWIFALYYTHKKTA